MAADMKKRVRLTPSRQRGRASEESDATAEDALPPGSDPEAPKEDVQDFIPVHGETQDSMLHTEPQDTTMDHSMQTAQQTAEKLFGSTREQVEKANQTMLKTAEEMQKLSKENFEAYVQASTIVAKGMQELGRAWTAYVQESLERSATATRALMGARTVQEVVSLQSEWAKASFDKFIAETTKLSEQTVKVTTEAMEPISTRLSVAAEKMKMPLAA